MLKAYGIEDGLEMEIADNAIRDPNAGAVRRAARAVTAFGEGSDAPGDVHEEVTLTLLSYKPMMLTDSEVEMQDRVTALETAVDDAVHHGLPPKCAKMLHEIVFLKQLDVFCRASWDDPPPRVEPMTGGRSHVLFCQPQTHIQHRNSWNGLQNSQAIYGSVAMAIPNGPTLTARSRTIGTSTTRSNQWLRPCQTLN